MNQGLASILAALMAAAVVIAGTFWAKHSGAGDTMVVALDSIAAAAFLVFQQLLARRD